MLLKCNVESLSVLHLPDVDLFSSDMVFSLRRSCSPHDIVYRCALNYSRVLILDGRFVKTISPTTTLANRIHCAVILRLDDKDSRALVGAILPLGETLIRSILQIGWELE